MTHVLIVEDYEENRTLLKMLLEANGYRVTAAGDGLEALTDARRDPPDAVISDVLMPKLDGFALCRAWMEDERLRGIPFIFYSATNVRAEDKEFGLTLGAARYLIKPLEAEVVLRELRAVLQQWGGHAAPAPAAPLEDVIFHTLHELALARKLEDKIAQLEAANRKLQESEARFRSLTEMSSDFYWESDAGHRLIAHRSANKELGTATASRGGVPIGERRWEIPYVSPDEAGWAAHRAVLDAHQPFRDFELSRLGTDDSEHFVSISGDPVFDASGAFAGYRGVGTDITERKRAERALRESEDRYRDLVENSGDLICTHNLDGKLLSVNAAALRLTGYSQEALLRMSMVDMLTRGARDGFAAYLAEVRTKGTARGLMQIRTADGRTRWWEYHNTLRTEGVAAPVVRGMAQDVTERKHAEEELRARELRYEAVSSSATDALVTGDAAGRIVGWNPSAARIFGYAESEVMGQPLTLLIPQRFQDQHLEGMKRVQSGGERRVIGKVIELAGRRKDASEFPLELSLVEWSVAEGHFFTAFIRDITERKAAEAKIQRYLAQIENAFMSTVRVVTTLGEMRDPYTAGHQRRVAEIAVAIGAELGFDARRQEGLLVAGYLHDIGKIRIPSEILSKPGKLSPIEFRLVQGHAQASYEVLKDVEFPWPVAEVARQHHERMDGSGYPQGLKGEAILLDARIMAVADVIEAMSSHRPYRPGLGIDKALTEIERGRGSAYDPAVADACLTLFRERRYQLPE